MATLAMKTNSSHFCWYIVLVITIEADVWSLWRSGLEVWSAANGQQKWPIIIYFDLELNRRTDKSLEQITNTFVLLKPIESHKSPQRKSESEATNGAEETKMNEWTENCSIVCVSHRLTFTDLWLGLMRFDRFLCRRQQNMSTKNDNNLLGHSAPLFG